MIVGILFVVMRCIELFFLIPPLGMLSEIIHVYLRGNEVTPAFALVLFIVIVLASVWALATLLFYRAARHNGYLLAFVDLCLFGALIAGVVMASGIATQNCSNITTNAYKQSGIWVYRFGDLCSLMKASYAFAILEIIFFFTTTLLALWVHHHHSKEDKEENYSRRTEKHYSRHSQRRSRSAGENGSRNDYNSRYDDRSRRGASRSRRSPARSYA